METTKNPLVKGQKVYLIGEHFPYKVMACSDRYAILSRRVSRKHDAALLRYEVEMGHYNTMKEAYKECKADNIPVYTILEFKTGLRNRDNMVFGIFDYADEKDCELAIEALHLGEIVLSHRGLCYIGIDFERTSKAR